MFQQKVIAITFHITKDTNKIVTNKIIGDQARHLVTIKNMFLNEWQSSYATHNYNNYIFKQDYTYYLIPINNILFYKFNYVIMLYLHIIKFMKRC